MTFRMGSRPRKEWGRFPGGETTLENNVTRSKNIAVTVLALDTDAPDEKVSSGRDADMPEQKLVQEFQTRRKYSRIRKPSREIARDKTLLELGLSGTKYRFGRARAESSEPDCSVRSGETGKEREEKVACSPRLSLPPISPRSGKSENATPFPSGFSSLLGCDFGFKKQVSDTFLGIHNGRRTFFPSELEKEMEVNAKRHIYACHNLGSVRKGSRAAQSVLGLKETMSHGFGSESPTRNMDNLDKSKSLERKKPSVLIHKTYPSLSHVFLKPTVNPEDGLPFVNGSSLFNVEPELEY